MTPEQFERLEALYDEAALLDPAARAHFIEEHCAGDPELRLALLEALRGASCGLTGIVAQAAAAAVETEDPWTGHRMGPYRIVRPLGRGGMGAVYLAVRDDDQFHKEVAIKTLKFELEGGPAVARFRHERQILAHLEHPNIARLLDGGTTGQGTPYIVLEYVAGVPLTDWCRQQQLSIEQRLSLFRQICDAVQYAHQHLVVHRDIKPGNILVTPEGVPMLLDFGIAKLLRAGAGTAEPLVATATGGMLMTPDYASPEQVRGEEVSTSTDVYSLGAVLYQLLSGERPYVIGNYDLLEIARIVCDTEIRPPSALGNRRLRGDLDIIVLKAMQKRPERRYRSVVELSEDIRRHLEGLPISARPDTAAYRATKFVRRHVVGVAAALAVIAALGAGLAVSLHEARIAQRRFSQVRELANTFLFQFYDQVTPLPGSTGVRAFVVETARKYLDGLAAEAGNDRSLILELAQAYQRLGNVQNRAGTANLGQVEQARRSYHRALDLYARLPVNRDSPPDLRRKAANAFFDLGRLEYNAYHEDAAEPVTRRMLNLLDGRDSDPATRMLWAIGERSLGDIRLRQGHASEGVALMESARQAFLDLQSAGYRHPSLPDQIALSLEHAARARVFAGDLDGAAALFSQLLQDSPPCNPEGPPGNACRTLSVRLTWAGDVHAATDRPNLEDPATAARLYEQTLPISERFVAQDAHDRQARFDLAARYGKLGDAVWKSDPKRALRLYDQALATARELASREQLEILRDSYFIAVSRPLIRLGRLAEARKAVITTLERGKTDARSPYVERVADIQVRGILPQLLLAEGKRAEAQRTLEQIIQDGEALRAGHSGDLVIINVLSDCYRDLAAITTGQVRREALLHSAAAWHSWPATSFTRRQEEKDLAEANR